MSDVHARSVRDLAADVTRGIDDHRLPGVGLRDEARTQAHKSLDEMRTRLDTLLRNIKDEAVQTVLAKEYGSEQFHRAEAAERELKIALKNWKAQVAMLTEERDAARAAHDLKVAVNRNAIEKWQAAETTIARQLTPLDVAVTHVEIVRRKGDEYTAQERDNVLAIVESHVKEARAALFTSLEQPKDVS